MLPVCRGGPQCHQAVHDAVPARKASCKSFRQPEYHCLEFAVTNALTFLQKFPDLKFKYVEEDQPEEFFVPYIWTLAAKKIYWDSANIKLFNPEN